MPIHEMNGVNQDKFELFFGHGNEFRLPVWDVIQKDHLPLVAKERGIITVREMRLCVRDAFVIKVHKDMTAKVLKDLGGRAVVHHNRGDLFLFPRLGGPHFLDVVEAVFLRFASMCHGAPRSLAEMVRFCRKKSDTLSRILVEIKHKGPGDGNR